MQVLVTSESSNMVHVIAVTDNHLVANVLVGAQASRSGVQPRRKSTSG